MKYSVVLIALVAAVSALPQDASSITSAPVASASLDPATASRMSCINSCDVSDVTCRAQCVGGARPNSSQAVASNECAAKCDQGDGSKADTDAYAKCQSDCFASLFPSSQTLGQGPASSAGGSAGVASAMASGTNSASAGSSPTGTGAQQTDASGSPTGSAAESTGTGAANTNSAKLLGAGLAGFMAVFAL